MLCYDAWMSALETTENTALTSEELASRVEAALLSVDKAMTPARIALALNLGDDGAGAVDEAVRALNEVYAATGRAFRIETIAGGYRVMTLPEFSDAVAALRGGAAAKSPLRARLGNPPAGAAG